jgi:hypothetical protein
VADDGAGDAHEGFVDVVADLPADAQPAEPVQQGDGLFDDPAADAGSGAVFGAFAARSGVMPRASSCSRRRSQS